LTATSVTGRAPMRILVVTDQYAPMVGGVPNVTQTLAHGLAGRGHAVTLLVPNPGISSQPPAGRADGHQVSFACSRSVRWPWYDGMRLALLSLSAARRLISALSPDVIHVHSPLTLGLMARLAARQLSIPVVYTNHYLPENVRPGSTRRSRLFDAAFYAYLVQFANQCAHVTAPTLTALQLLRAQGLRAPAQVISNGIDLRTYCPGPADSVVRDRYGLRADRPVILYVGRLSQEKGVDVLLAAVARLTTGVQVAIAGRGPDSVRLAATADRLGLSDRVRFLGFVPDADLPAVYRLADVFVIPSKAELQSLATMEAMATGLPVVASDAYSLRELVSHGKTGLLTTPGRADELAASLDMLLGAPGVRARMAQESLRAVGAHEQSRTWLQWESLYGQLAAGGPR
jgi:glycosyltransferase involved in cell wall biosynthesis